MRNEMRIKAKSRSGEDKSKREEKEKKKRRKSANEELRLTDAMIVQLHLFSRQQPDSKSGCWWAHRWAAMTSFDLEESSANNSN